SWVIWRSLQRRFAHLTLPPTGNSVDDPAWKAVLFAGQGKEVETHLHSFRRKENSKMSGFQNILFPVDFSDRCRAASPFVRSMASRFHARLTLIHVIQIPIAWYAGIEGACPVMFDLAAMEESAKEEMRAFYEADAGVEYVVQVGDPAGEIVAYAEQNSIDLIMMPTHGYGKFRALLLGSVVTKVLHDAKCPVWTAAHTGDPNLPKHLECKNMIGAVDLKPETVPLIRRYADLANATNAKLRLVHAVPGAAPDPHWGAEQEFTNFLLQSARRELAKLQAEAGTNLEVCMEGGPVSKIVAAAALHHDVDLILSGRGVLTESFGRLRSNSYSIIRDAPCPVLSM